MTGKKTKHTRAKERGWRIENDYPTNEDTEGMKSHGFTITADADEYSRTVSDYRAECDCGWESKCCDTRQVAIALHNEHLAFVVNGPHSVKED